jgi:hypothetical protein
MNKTDEVYIDDIRDRWTDKDMIEFGRYIELPVFLRSDITMKELLLLWAHNKDKEKKK